MTNKDLANLIGWTVQLVEINYAMLSNQAKGMTIKSHQDEKAAVLNAIRNALPKPDPINP